MKKETPINFHDLLGDGWVNVYEDIKGLRDKRFERKHSAVVVFFRHSRDKFIVLSRDNPTFDFPGCQTMEQLRSLEQMLKG